MASVNLSNSRQHNFLSTYSVFISIATLFLSFPGSLEYTVIDDLDVAKSDNVYEWLARMMRAQSDDNGPNSVFSDKTEFQSYQPALDSSSILDEADVGDDYVNGKGMGDVDELMLSDGRNLSLISQGPLSPTFGGVFKSDGVISVNSNAGAGDNWWTLCQLPVFIVVFAVVGVLAVTFIVLIWLKSQMLESDKSKTNKGGEENQKMVCPCPTHASVTDDRWIFHTVINFKCGAEDKTTIPVQPQESNSIVENVETQKVEPLLQQIAAEEVSEPRPSPTPSPTPEKRPEVVRMKGKGLLERRGSNVSLTIDLPQANSDQTAHVITPTRECSAEEFLLSAGNALCRSQLRICLRDTGSLHREFWDIPLNHPDENQAVGCAGKNRYRSILPNERSRVLLEDTQDPYINANYVRGYDGEEKVYIATQGPLGNTVSDLYQMIWTHRCPIIVMMTNLVEKTKPKCEPYFPLGLHESATYGEFEVSVVELLPRQGYVLRHLLIQHKGEARRLLHYWYDTWPDHKTPQNTHVILAMATEVEKVRTNFKNIKSPNNNDSVTDCNGPVVVHCSAGIGRTGCFIAISLAICQLLEENKVDLLGIVCQMRYDRGGMIQTAEQYEFVHRSVAVFEASLPDAPSSTHD